MLKFGAQQKVIELGKVKVGGQPGENPTVLIGSIFYHGHKIVEDQKTGKIDEKGAEELIRLQDEFSDRTGNPCMLDVVASTKVAMESFISFVAGVTEALILIDSPSVEAKIGGAKFASEIGLEKRVVYNSLIPQSKSEELEAIEESGVESAILLAYEGAIMTSEARVDAVKELLPKVEEFGITKPLLDTFVIDIPSLSMACRAMLELKRKLGFPCGCGAHNAISTWHGLEKRIGPKAVNPCEIAVAVTPVVLGADFILYGPIENCTYVFPSVYAIDTSYRYLYKMKDQLEL